MKSTQLDRIIQMCIKGDYVCQAEFWKISKSPHKRRSDIEKEGLWRFEPRKCQHGIKNSHDYRMIPVTSKSLEKQYTALGKVKWEEVYDEQRKEWVRRQILV